MEYATPLALLVDPKYVSLVSSGGRSGWLYRIGVVDYDVASSDADIAISLRVVPLGEEARQEVSLLELPGVEFLLGPWTEASIGIEAILSDQGFQLAASVPLAVRLAPPLFNRVDKSTMKVAPNAAEGILVPLAAPKVSLEVKTDEVGDVGMDLDLDLQGSVISIPEPFMIGMTGIVLQVEGLAFNFSGKGLRPAEAPSDWTGIYVESASVYLPDLMKGAVRAEALGIGSGGIYGSVSYQGTEPLEYDRTAKKFKGAGNIIGDVLGLQGGISKIDIELKQNVLTKAGIEGKILLPFFDEPLEVAIGLTYGGRFTIGLRGEDGLLKLEKPGLLELKLSSIEFDNIDGAFLARLSGKLTPLFGKAEGLKWPTFDVKELSIDSQGHVHLDGGWLDVPKQATLDFYGFKIEITQIGFGSTDDGGKWIGFSGGLKLVDGFQAGASVEGLRITWYDDTRGPKITLNGAGVELIIPDVLSFKGVVSFRELEKDGEKIQQFDGDIKLKLEKPKLEVDGKLVIGSATGPEGKFNFLAIYLDAQLPTGIPLGTTGLSIYGMSGLFALQREPDKKPDETWYNLDHSKSWYHRDTVGVTDIRKKWAPRRGRLALGAGITLGTNTDDGYLFNGKFLLALVLPGPIIFLQGSSNLLKKRTEGTEEALFRSLAVFDGRESSITIGIDAEYKAGKKGEMIEIAAGTEAFFDFDDPGNWHLYIGQRETRDRRVRALLGRFAEVNAYFMLEPGQLALGAWFGYDRKWKVGPLRIGLEAWAEGNAVLSFKPTQFHGDLWLHGLVELKVFRFGLGLTLDVNIAADLFTPYHLLGEFRVRIRLPWPLKSVGAKVRLEWGPRPELPPIPLPLHDVAIEHLKTVVNWPLARGTLLLPSYDDGEGFIGPAQGALQPSVAIPVVPLDARPHLTFSRPIHDQALVAVNARPPDPARETIGDPTRGEGQVTVRYALTGIALEKQAGSGWNPVAVSPPAEFATTPALFGSWAPVPGGAGTTAQTKLWLWVKNPFSYTRRTDTSWEEWFAGRFPGYPCPSQRLPEKVCDDFQWMFLGAALASPWTVRQDLELTLSWAPGAGRVTLQSEPFEGLDRALCFSAEAATTGIRVDLAESVTWCAILLGKAPGQVPLRRCVDFQKFQPGAGPNPRNEGEMTFEAELPQVSPRISRTLVEQWNGSPPGLNTSRRLVITLPCPAARIELLLTNRAELRVEAVSREGAVLAARTLRPRELQAGMVTLEGRAIRRIVLQGTAFDAALLHRICFQCPDHSWVKVTGFDAQGHPYGPSLAEGRTVEVSGRGITRLAIQGEGPVCLLRICAMPDPEAGQVVRPEEYVKHMQEELARWEEEGEILEPNTTYRLVIQTRAETENPSSPHDLTEYAYFRTEGPPGVTRLLPPEGVPQERFDSGLDDLARYVRQTTPPTVPSAGEKPILFKPFYRAYDLGVELNEDYVEQMYRMDGRDLGLYLYDNNNQPVRDGLGRLLVLGSQWGRAETLTLSERDTHWITMIDAATCLPKKLDPQTFPRDSVLTSAQPGRVLAADTFHEARLVPLLLHEAFTEAKPGDAPPGWHSEDAGPGGPSVWKVGEVGVPPSRFVEQASSIGGTSPDRPGTTLLLAESSAWTDYRVSVYVRSAAGGAVGVVVRHQGPGSGYRFSLDGGVRRLVKGDGTQLAVDHFAHRKDRDYLLTVEALGKSLRAYVDGEPVFAVEDAGFDQGRIGLYTCQSPGARFADIRVDDFRPGAPVVYRFQVTTSLYANFFHHLHSFEDETWTGTLAGSDLGSLLAEARLPAFSMPEEAEARAYAELADRALGPAALQNPGQVEVTRLAQPLGDPVLLVRSPEPIDWTRVELALSRARRPLTAPQTTGALKLTDAGFAALHPEEEFVSLLLREGMELTRHRIEVRTLPGPLAEPAGDPILWLRDRFAAGDLAGWSLASEVPGPLVASAAWETVGGMLRLKSLKAHGGDPAWPGAYALAGDPAWTDVIFRVRLRSKGGAIGVVFRAQGLTSWYRFAMSRERGMRQLVRKAGGTATVLWQDRVAYEADRAYELTIAAVGSSLRAWLDGVPLFAVEDVELPAGRIGLYAWSNTEAWFSEVRVWPAALGFAAWGLDEPFDELVPGRWSFLNEAGAPAPGPWKVENGALRCGPEPVAWNVPRGGVNGNVLAIAASQGEVFVAGDFTAAGGVPANRIAVWSEGAWSALGEGLDGIVRALAVDGLRVYVGGQFTRAGGVPARNVAVWDRAAKTWSALGAGVDGVVHALVVMGDRVYAGGQLTSAGGVRAANAANIAAWNKASRSWEVLGAGVDLEVMALAAQGGFLYVGGHFTRAGGQPASRVARWDGQSWVGATGAFNGAVLAVAVGEGGLYIGGRFTVAGGTAANRIARWTGSGWAPLGAGLDGPVEALAMDGNQIWVAGRFTQAGGVPANRIARWNRSARSWSPLGQGLPAAVLDLAVDEGRLWAGGNFPRGISALSLGGARFAVISEAAPAEARLAVRLVPGPDGAAAVLLGWQDPGNHLAFWLDAEHGFRRLVLTRLGESQVLWTDSVRPEAGREHAVTIDAAGGRLIGWVNGVELFDVKASLEPAGAVGVAVRRSPGARFREIRWAAPEWTCWHAFGEEEWLPAGTRVRVHGAMPSLPAPAEAGLTIRSAALTGESGQVRFSPRAAELRLMGPDSAPGHARTFLPAGAYEPVSSVVIRKADGTAFFLMASGAPGATEGPLRLELTYHRARPEAGRPFSQAGDGGPERVTIDIP